MSVISTDTTFSYRDFNNINLHGLEEEISTTSWNEVYNCVDVNDKLGALNHNILHLYNNHVYIKHGRTSSKTKPWFNSGTKLLIQQRDTAYNKWKRYRTLEQHLVYKSLRKAVTNKVLHDKKQYYNNKFNRAISGQQTWKEIKNIGFLDSNSSTATIDVNDLNSKFVNIDIPSYMQVLALPQ